MLGRFPRGGTSCTATVGQSGCKSHIPYWLSHLYHTGEASGTEVLKEGMAFFSLPSPTRVLCKSWLGGYAPVLEVTRSEVPEGYPGVTQEGGVVTQVPPSLPPQYALSGWSWTKNLVPGTGLDWTARVAFPLLSPPVRTPALRGDGLCMFFLLV